MILRRWHQGRPSFTLALHAHAEGLEVRRELQRVPPVEVRPGVYALHRRSMPCRSRSMPCRSWAAEGEICTVRTIVVKLQEQG